MAELVKKLCFLANGVKESAKIYSTADETIEHVPVIVDGEMGYVPVGDVDNVLATHGRVTRLGRVRAVLSSATLPDTETTTTS